MRFSIWQGRFFKSSFVTSLAVAAMLSSVLVTPAFADRDHGRGDRGHRDWHDHRGAYVYAQPVYAPPTVYVAPQPSPGISLFLPIVIRR
ncbi:MAG TPA: hypothetical protein VK832_18015 [Burkholderiaceae bacterium]|jgi:hypothetical protein|nr:hypothetical protein [Burkholderiaceae bacterium]